MTQMQTMLTQALHQFQATADQQHADFCAKHAEQACLTRELFTNATTDRSNDAQAIATVVTSFQQHVTDSSAAIQQAAQAAIPPAGAAPAPGAAAPAPPPCLTNIPTRALPTVPNIKATPQATAHFVCFVLFGLQLSVCLWWLQVPLRDLSDA